MRRQGGAVTGAEEVLRAADSVLIVDWPSRDVPDTLTGAGYDVVVKGGPEPDTYSVHEWHDGTVVVHSLGHPPEHADIVYAHRPLRELPQILVIARLVGARAVWCQSGMASAGTKDPQGCWVAEDESHQARRMVEEAGLAYVDDVYIADVVRRLDIRKPGDDRPHGDPALGS